MFQLAQEDIGFFQFLLHRRVGFAFFLQALQGAECGRITQVGIAPALDQLLGLAEKFDLADAAAADLDVMPLQRDFRKALMGVDLRLDCLDIFDGGEIHGLAPDEGREEVNEFLTRREIPGDGPRLNHGGAFPVLSLAFVIDMGGADREGDGCRAGIGPEPEVGAEDISVAGAFLHHGDKVAGDAHEAVLHRAAAGIGDLVRLEQDDHVDVGGIVEFPRPELAHAEDDESAVLCRIARMGQGKVAFLRRRRQQMPAANLDRGACEIGEHAGYLHQWPDLAKIRERRQQRNAPLGDAERRHHRITIRFQRCGALHLLIDPVQGRLRPVLHQMPEQLRLGKQTTAQKRAVAEDSVQDFGAVRHAVEFGCEVGKGRILRRDLPPALQADGQKLRIPGGGKIPRDLGERLFLGLRDILHS